MSDKKTIQINPELFRIPEKQKRAPKNLNKPIHVKSPNMPKNKTIRNQIMKMIRSKQQEKYKELFNDKEVKNTFVNPITPIDEFKKEFNQSLEYLSDLAKKKKEKIPQSYTSVPSRSISKDNKETLHDKRYNATIKNHSYPHIPKPNSYENVSLDLPNIFDEVQPIKMSHTMVLNPKVPPIQPLSHHISSNINSNKITIPPPPPYGILKVGGNKPTYRTLNNQTFKNREPIISHSGEFGDNPNSIENIKRASELRQKIAIQKREQEEKEKQKKGKKKLRYLKQKKIYKRTYRVGRSKYQPKIGVLISNKTIRNNISTKTQLLKQEPIQDIKKFLIKKGFIKVGTPTPNDILRKMYESVVLICGEVQNHNAENLLYNFIHDSK